MLVLSRIVFGQIKDANYSRSLNQLPNTDKNITCTQFSLFFSANSMSFASKLLRVISCPGPHANVFSDCKIESATF